MTAGRNAKGERLAWYACAVSAAVVGMVMLVGLGALLNMALILPASYAEERRRMLLICGMLFVSALLSVFATVRAYQRAKRI